VSLSLDNFVAGASLGLIGVPRLLCALVMGSVSGLMAVAGLQSGRLTQRVLGLSAEWFGGLAIVVIALSLLVRV
jgi:putative Mn2+ efflux pump MntP